MSIDLEQTLTGVAEDTIMSLAFLFSSMDEGPTAGVEMPTILAEVDFIGPCRGALVLHAPQGMLPELASNMLGLTDEDPPPQREHQLDAAKELINVVCGNLLPKIGGPEAVFNVAAPTLELNASVPAERFGAGPVATAIIDLETGPVELALFVDQAEPVSAG